jgi:hypothetical protein
MNVFDVPTAEELEYRNLKAIEVNMRRDQEPV